MATERHGLTITRRPVRRIHPLCAAVVLLAGCAKPEQSIQQQGKQAWDQYRAGVKLELAKAELQKGNIEQARALALEIGGLSPDQPAHAELLARTYIASGDFNAARPIVENALRVHAGHAGLNALMGLMHERAQEWTPAAQAYRAAADAEPTRVDHVVAWANATARGATPQAGLAILREAQSRFATEPAIHLAVAELCRIAEDLPAACAAYQRALQTGADERVVREPLGMCLYWSSRFDEARDYLAPIAGTSNASAGIMSAYGRCLIKTGKSADARNWLQRVTSERPQHAPLWLLLAEACWKSGDKPAAIRAARRATQVDPESGEAHMVLAVIYLDSGDLEDAARAACKAVDLGPKSADAYVLLGRIYESRGDRSTAREMYQSALGIEPRHSTAAEMLARAN